MDLSFRKHDTCASGIFNGKLSFAVLTSDSADCTAQMVAVQRLDIFNFKSLQEKIVESQQRNGCENVSTNKKMKR